MTEGFTFQGVLTKITTTVDGGWRITFDLPANQSNQISELSSLRESALQIGLVPIPDEFMQNDSYPLEALDG